MAGENSSELKTKNADDYKDNGPSKLDISIGVFSLKSEGKPALLMSELVQEQFPKLVEVLKSQNFNELMKEVSPLIKDIAPHLAGIVNSYLNRATTSASGVTIPADAKVAGNDDIPGKAGRTV